MAEYGQPFVLKGGHDLLHDGGSEGNLGAPFSLGHVWHRYQKWVLGRVHTDKCLLKEDVRKLPDGEYKFPFDVLPALLGGLGFAAEAGEVGDEHKKLLFHGSDYKIKREKIIEELGDAMWYFVVTLAAHGITLEEVLAYNVDKLVKRNGVNSERFSERAKSGL